MQKILILGISGMLGRELFYQFSNDENYEIYGTRRKESTSPRVFKAEVNKDINISEIEGIIKRLRPHYVINCIGAIHQKAYSDSDLFYLNAVLPHQLSICCTRYVSKLIHISTDCVFSGKDGMYDELSIPDPVDAYGMSKTAGEVECRDHMTIRTSILGHEVSDSKHSLIDWFLSNKDGDEINGYAGVIYTGMPTYSLAEVLRYYVIPSNLRGIWNVSADPIDKCSILNLVNKTYNRDIKINPDFTFLNDRSLDSSRFRNVMNWKPWSWEKLIRDMRESYLKDNERNDIQE